MDAREKDLQALRVTSPYSLDYQNSATRVILKDNAVDDIAAYIDTLGLRRVLGVIGPRTSASDLWKKVSSLLGDRLIATCNEVVPHSSTELVDRWADQARHLHVDGFLTLGGGSAVDTARGIALVTAEGGKIEDFKPEFIPPNTYRPKPLLKPKLPVIAIPLTASAAEVTPTFGITDAQRHKIVFRDDKLFCRMIILDPVANLTVPFSLMATTSMNGLAHSFEGLYSRSGNAISDGLALHSIGLFSSALIEMADAPDDAEQRKAVLAAAHISGMVLANTRMAVHHMTCHALGAIGGLSHGVANSIFLPHALEFNKVEAAPALALAARSMGLQIETRSKAYAAEAAIDEVRKIQGHLGVPTRLRDTSFDRKLIPVIAEHTFKSLGMSFNPRQVAAIDPIIQLIEGAW